jgi:hypothetical protein
MRKIQSTNPKRKVLLSLSSVYDPLDLGLVTPAKKFLQDSIWMGRIELISKMNFPIWKQWLSCIYQMSRISQCRVVLKLENFENHCSAQLHHFSGACENGYGVFSSVLEELQNWSRRKVGGYVAINISIARIYMRI